MKKFRNKQDIATLILLYLVTLICASSIVWIIGFILIKGLSPFIKSYMINGKMYSVNFFSFLVGNEWHRSPNIYHIGYIFINNIYILFFTLLLSIPCSIFSAMFIARIAPRAISKILKTVIELLASIPSIIYGVFGLGILTKIEKWAGNLFGIQTYGGLGNMTTILVLSIMIIPTITILSIDSINAVDKRYINGSIALGASTEQTNFCLILKCARSGILSGIVLGIGRALGEATAISMVCGNSKLGPNFSLFEKTRTLTSTMMLGLTETDGLDYDIRYSVGIVLILLILGSNLLLNYVRKRLEEKGNGQKRKASNRV